MTVDRESIPADGVETAVITVQLKDSAGENASPSDVVIQLSGGNYKLNKMSAPSSGEMTTTFLVQATSAGDHAVLVRVGEIVLDMQPSRAFRTSTA